MRIKSYFYDVDAEQNLEISDCDVYDSSDAADSIALNGVADIEYTEALLGLSINNDLPF